MKTVNNREEYLSEVASYFNSKKEINVIELGVMYGDFSKMILEKLNPGTLTLVDPYEKNEQLYDCAGLEGIPTAYSTQAEYVELLKKFEKEISTGQVIVERKYSHDAAKNYLDNCFDLIYIDACHLYSCVKRDLNDYLRTIEVGGLIAGHDYCEGFPGVIQAVDEFRKENDFEMILLNNNGHDWALKRI